MSDPDTFLRRPLAGGDPADDLAVHVGLLSHRISPPCMPTVYSDGEVLFLRFDEWASLEGFLDEIASHALEHQEMIPYLTKMIDWHVSLNIALDRSDHPYCVPISVRPTLRLTCAAVVALALTVAYDHWFEDGEDRSQLIPP